MRTIRWTTFVTSIAFLAACEDPPDPVVKPLAPTVSVNATTCTNPAPVTGTKQSSTSVWINGVEVVPLDESTTFSTSVQLMEGTQTLTIWVQSATGDKSDTIEVSTSLDLTRPAAPVIPDPPLVIMPAEYEITGTKDAGTSILVNGAEVVPANADTTWSHTVTLALNNNPFRITARDACLESDPIVELNLFHDPSGVGLTVMAPTSPTCSDSQEIKGARAEGVAVLLDGTEIIPAGAAGAWTWVVPLMEGTNNFEFVGKVGNNVSLAHSISIEYDATPPAAPSVGMAPEYTCEATLALSGTKDANTAVLVNDVVVVEENEMAAYSFNTALSEGLNQLQIDTRDFCGRTSGNPAVIRITLDTMNPTIMITNPMMGQTMTGLATIEGEAMDNFEVQGVEISIDGGRIATVVTTSTFAATWDTTSVTDGTHLLGVTAVDRAGKRSMLVSIQIEVANSARVVSEEPPPPNMDPQQARSARPSVAALPNGDLAVTWHDNLDISESGNDDDILLRLYMNGTVPMSTLVVSDHDADGRSQNAKVAAAAGNGVHIVIQEDGDIDGDRVVDWDIVYRSYAGGALSNAFIVLSIDSNGQDGRSQFPAMASDSTGNAHVVWQDDGDLDGDGTDDKDIYYAVGNANGFNAPFLVSNHPMDGESARPQIAITPDNCPHVVWQETGDIAGSDNDMALDIYYRGSTSNGAGGCTWGALVLISEENAFTTNIRPAIAADPLDNRGLVWIAWEGEGEVANNGTDRDVFLRNVFASVAGQLILISDDPMDGQSQEAAIVVDGNTDVHIAWVDTGNIGGTGMDADIFTRSWNGAMFSPIASVSDIGMNAINTEDSLSPSMSVNGLRVYFSWDDRSDYDGDGVADADILLLTR